MTDLLQSPAALRGMFGANLRQLSSSYPSISDLSRRLGINRTQFNRYLSGESFPRPDVLARICAFFDVDARVLLEPVDQINGRSDPLSNSFLDGFIRLATRDIPNKLFPSGFYRFSRRSFTQSDRYVLGTVHARRIGAHTFIRGYEPRRTARVQDVPAHPRAREFRGLVLKQDDGVLIVVSRRNAVTFSFNSLRRIAAFGGSFWLGHVTRIGPEPDAAPRVTRMVYEFLGTRIGDVLPAARQSGFPTSEEVLPDHRKLLHPEGPFS